MHAIVVGEGQQSRSSDDEGMGPVPSRWKGIFWLHTIYRPLVVALFLEKMFLVLGTELLESTNIRIQECRISTWCENHKVCLLSYLHEIARRLLGKSYYALEDLARCQVRAMRLNLLVLLG